MQVQSLVVGNAAHSSILAWKISQTEEPGSLTQGHKESDTTEHTHARAHTHTHTHTVLPGSSAHCLPSVYRNKHTHGQHAGIYTHGHVCMPVTTNCASVRVSALLLTPIASLGVLQGGVAGVGRGIK